MKKYILTALIVVLSISNLKADFFNVSGINTDEFPWVSTVFVAKDENNNFIKDATVQQFSVSENGIYKEFTDMKIECFQTQDVPELSIVLVVDRSGSMKEVFDEEKPEDTRWSRVKSGVETFLNTIEFVGRTRVALVSFSGDSKMACDFTQNPQEILDSLDAVELAGKTEYTPPYIKTEYEEGGITKRESATSLLKTRPEEIKRIVVFLTDGEPSGEPETEMIVDSLNYYNISAYNLSFLTNMHESLNEISQRTNGKSYAVASEDDLDHYYSQIAIKAQESYFCKLSWLADYPCYESQTDRSVEITFKGVEPFGVKRRDYNIPEQHIPVRSWSKQTYSFGNPEIGPDYSVKETLELIINNVDFNIENFELTPNDQGFKILEIRNSEGELFAENTIVPQGDTIYIDIEFEQFDTKTLRTATLTSNGTPCLTSVDVVGGTTDIILESPNSGEVYTVCDNIGINWSGVANNVETHLSYSNDNFISDSNFIISKKGSPYNWSDLPEPGKYKIKLRVDPEFRYIFAVGDKSDGRSYGSSIALSRDERFIYSVGNYSDQLQIDDTTIENLGNYDAFLAKHNSAGRLMWINSLGGDGLDSASGVCVDDDENVYITGATSKGAKFGTASVNNPLPGSVFFIAKTSSVGSSYTVRYIAAKTPYDNFEAWGTKIRYDEVNERVIVQGGFKNDYVHQTSQGTFDFDNQINNRFTAYYDKDLNFLNLQFGAIQGDYSSNEAETSDEKSTYKIETIYSNKSYGSIDVEHNGNGDVIITRFGQNEPSEDVSELEFTIEKPILNYSVAGPLVLDDAPINKLSFKKFDQLVVNESILPIEIEEVTITGANMDEFSLDNTFDGLVESGVENARDLTINFIPNSAGFKTAELNIKGSCAEVITITLEGNGICDMSNESLVSFGASNIDISVNREVDQVFTNNNGVPIRITPRIENDNDNEFKIVSINDNTGLVGASLTLDPNESIKIELSFTPISEGNKSATLEFNPETDGCQNLATDLNGTGANTDLSYAIVDFQRKRIQTVNYLNLEIINSGSLPVEVHDIYLDNTEAFVLELPDNLTVETDKPLVIPIRFNPQTEGNYSEPVNIIINEGDEPLSLNNAVGIGENPTVVPTIDCKGNSVQNTTTQVDLILTNNSSISKTEVLSLTISNTSDYTFIDGTKTLNNIELIDENNYKVIPLNFTPTIAGINTLDLTVESNTAIGNNVDAVVNDPINENKSLDCNALQSSGTDDITFLGVLVCDSHTKMAQYTNQNPNEDLTVQSATFTPSNYEFSTDLPASPFIIDAGTTFTFNIDFTPSSIGLQSTTLTLEFDDGTTKSFNIQGTGKRIRYFTDSTKFETSPGNTNILTVKADVPELDYKLGELNVSMSHNPYFTSFTVDQNDVIIPPVSSGINWNWTTTNAANLSQFKNFNGTANTTNDSLLSNNIYDLFDIEYTVYLSSDENDNLAVSSLFDDCPNLEYNDVQEVGISGVCAIDKRLVSFGETPIRINSSYDGNYNLIRAEFTVMFDNLSSEFNIIDINGNTVLKDNISNLNKGRYEATFDASSLSAGVYFIKFNSGAYSDMSKVLIVR